MHLVRTCLHVFKAIASTHHMNVKFPTKNGIEEEKGDQKIARSCYMATLKPERIGAKDSR